MSIDILAAAATFRKMLGIADKIQIGIEYDKSVGGTMANPVLIFYAAYGEKHAKISEPLDKFLAFSRASGEGSALQYYADRMAALFSKATERPRQVCECELFARRWNTNTGECETCGRRYPVE